MVLRYCFNFLLGRGVVGLLAGARAMLLKSFRGYPQSFQTNVVLVFLTVLCYFSKPNVNQIK